MTVSVAAFFFFLLEISRRPFRSTWPFTNTSSFPLTVRLDSDALFCFSNAPLFPLLLCKCWILTKLAHQHKDQTAGQISKLNSRRERQMVLYEAPCSKNLSKGFSTSSFCSILGCELACKMKFDGNSTRKGKDGREVNLLQMDLLREDHRRREGELQQLLFHQVIIRSFRNRPHARKRSAGVD